MSPISPALGAVAQCVDERLHQLAAITDDPQGKTLRTFLSPAMRDANRMVAKWMQKAGMKTEVDAWGNLRGRISFPTHAPKNKVLLLGSHLDTVPNAGRFDGPMGVLLGLAAIELLIETGIAQLPFDLEVVGFSDEEGVRFQVPYLGSRALMGKIDTSDLECRDAHNITLADVIKAQTFEPVLLPLPSFAPDDLLAYLEVHLEQGPILEKENQAVGLVHTVAAQSRLQVRIKGKAAHAGTTPMNLRRDALAGAAECLFMLEDYARKSNGLVITAGQLEVRPGTSNVVPEETTFTLDVRQADTDANAQLVHKTIPSLIQEIASRRNLSATIRMVREIPGIEFSSEMNFLLEKSILKFQSTAPVLTSGAGHDAVVLASFTPTTMLFVRCRDGLSHHPDEFVSVEDMGLALAVLVDFITHFKPKPSQTSIPS